MDRLGTSPAPLASYESGPSLQLADYHDARPVAGRIGLNRRTRRGLAVAAPATAGLLIVGLDSARALAQTSTSTSTSSAETITPPVNVGNFILGMSDAVSPGMGYAIAFCFAILAVVIVYQFFFRKGKSAG